MNLPSISGVLLLVAIPAIPFAAYVRFARHNPAIWHVDPSEAKRRGPPNRIVLNGPEAIILTAPPEIVAKTFSDIALEDPNTVLLAGSENWLTFLTRSPVFKYPDYTSIRAELTEDGQTSLTIFARARFGHRDNGANRKRVDAWLTELGTRVPGDMQLSMSL